MFNSSNHNAPYTLATHIVVPEGAVARKCAATASRDHNVTLDAGTYPIHWEFSPEGWPVGGSAQVPATAHHRWESTVELGGVALAGEDRGGERETYSVHMYGYQTNGAAKFAQYGLLYS